jgi:uncharacterized protein YbcI
MSKKKLLTRGQLERSISQRIQTLYCEQLGHRPDRVTCDIVDDRIHVIMENAITQAEQLLSNTGKEELIEQVRLELEQAIEPMLKELIEEVVGIKVVDLLSDTTLETGRSGMIVVLSGKPEFRQSSSTSNSKKNTSE